MNINEKKVILIYKDEMVMEWARYLPDEGKYERHNDVLNRIQDSVPDIHKAVIIFEFRRNHENTVFIPKVTYDYQRETIEMVMPFEEGMRYCVFVENENGIYLDIDKPTEKEKFDEMLKVINERIQEREDKHVR